MIMIENKKTYRGNGIYIGRPSLLGIPYAIGKDGTTEDTNELDVAGFREAVPYDRVL